MSDIEIEADVLTHLTDAERAALAETDDAVQPQQPETEYRQEPVVPLAVKVDHADIANRLAQADAAEREVSRLFDEGDITSEEYREKMRQVEDYRSEARWQAQKADLAADMRKTVDDAAWFDNVSKFMTTGPGVSIANSQTLQAAFDQHVRAVTRNEPHLSDRAQLNKAWRAFKQEMDGAVVTFGSAPGRSRNARHDDGLEVSRALGAMGDGRGAVDFSALDRLSGLALEKAMASMSPDERDAYMRAG